MIHYPHERKVMNHSPTPKISLIVPVLAPIYANLRYESLGLSDWMIVAIFVVLLLVIIVLAFK